LSTYAEHAQMMFWDTEFAMLHRSYVRAVERAGGIAVLLPPQGGGDDVARAVVDRLDGLILSGGADVDPSLYGQEPGPRTGKPRTDRDAWELALLRAAEELDLPTLCICRGLQLLNVARGGTLHQHVPDVVESVGHQPSLGTFGRITVALESGSLAAAALGSSVSVACHHHQSVAEVGTGLAVTGRAGDGTIEALESSERSFLAAVQWHPEQQDSDIPLFHALVAAAAAATGDPHEPTHAAEVA